MTREISRQVFVRGALGAAAAGVLLGSCRSTTAPSAGFSMVPDPKDWAALDNSIEGTLALPADGDYTAAKSLFNTRFDDSAPAAVVAVKSIGDVQQAMAFVTKSGLKITARGGGHSYVGASAANGALVLDLRQLPGDTGYDAASELAIVSAAAQLDSVQTELSAPGRSIPTGSCPTVGIAGLTLGGGLGSDARQWGLTCDALVSATVVLPSGDVVTAAAADHDDLYWALRGGGGQFGVATSFTFRTHQVTDRDVVTLVFPEAAAAQAILGWHQWLGSADRAIWGMVNLGRSGSGLRCTIVLATPPGGGPGAAGDLSAAIGVPPVSNTNRTLGHMDFVRYFAGGTDSTRPRAVVAGSDVIGELTYAAADSIVVAASALPSALGSTTTVIESLSGALSDVEPTGTAFPWRRQAACVQWYTETPSQAAVDAANGWLAGAHQAVGAHSVGGYLNYLEADTPAQRYFDGNVLRLKEIRQKYDPDTLMYSSLPF